MKLRLNLSEFAGGEAAAPPSLMPPTLSSEKILQDSLCPAGTQSGRLAGGLQEPSGPYTLGPAGM